MSGLSVVMKKLVTRVWTIDFVKAIKKKGCSLADVVKEGVAGRKTD